MINPLMRRGLKMQHYFTINDLSEGSNKSFENKLSVAQPP